VVEYGRRARVGRPSADDTRAGGATPALETGRAALGGGWSAHQLTELLAVVSAAADERSAVETAVAFARRALEADLAALVRAGEPVTTAGPVDAAAVPLLAAVAPGTGVLALPGLGTARTASVEVDGGVGTLLLARADARPFPAEELALLREMGRVLALTLRLLRARDEDRRLGDEVARRLAGLQARQRLFEEIAVVQRSISEQVRPEETFETIVEAAAAVLGCELVALRLLDPNDPSYTTVAAARGLPAFLGRSGRRSPAGEGVAGRALVEGRLVVAEEQDDLRSLGTFGLADVGGAMAAPVRESGAVVGSLVVGSAAARRFDEEEGELLLRLAEHAGIALAAAKAAEAARQTFTDTLTGLANRTLFLDRLEHALARAERSGSDVTALILDLDRFRLVNDSLGHIAGDRLLAQVAERVRGCLRRSDTAARLGGDEFGILLSESRGAARPSKWPSESSSRSRSRSRWTAASWRSPRASASPRARPSPRTCSATRTSPRAREGGGRSEPRRLRARHARRDGRGARAPRRPDARARARRDRPRVPADRGLRRQPALRSRGARALAPPDARQRAARRLHPAGRGDGPDRRDRRARAA
jgi:GGDEF domain-containing protein